MRRTKAFWQAREEHARVRRVRTGRRRAVSCLRQLASASMRSNGEPPRGAMSAGFWSGSGAGRALGSAGLGWAELKWAGCLGWISGLGLF